MHCLRAGRIECEYGDGRDDEDQGPAVLGELEAGERQDVRAPALRLACLRTALVLSLATTDTLTDTLQRPLDSSPLPHASQQGTLPGPPCLRPH
jgi:hypothetical protein